MATEATVFDEADLNALTDGRLEPARAAALCESLASDRLARARVDAWKRQNDSLRTLFASVLFEPVPVRLMQTTFVTGDPGLDPVSAREVRAAGRGSSAAVLAVTAVGVALVGFMAGALATIATDGFGRAAWGSRSIVIRPAVADSSALASRAAEAYRAMLADPERNGDVSAGDETRLQHWMTRQLGRAARIPDLSREGWSLIGGRVVPGQHAPAVSLLFGQGADRLGLYVAREPTPVAAGTRPSADAALTITPWSENGLGVALVSIRDLRGADDRFDRLKGAVRHQMVDDQTTP